MFCLFESASIKNSSLNEILEDWRLYTGWKDFDWKESLWGNVNGEQLFVEQLN